MRTPTFKYHGSKCRVAKWILYNINFKIDNYYEPFAGRGNVFFRLANDFKYYQPNDTLSYKWTTQQNKKVFLNDPHTYKFLIALQQYDGDYDFVPNWIDKDIYNHFMKMKHCHEKYLAESFCAYNGAFFGGGANLTDSPTHPSLNKHNKKNTIQRFKNAKILLKDVNISNLDYKEFFKLIQQTLTPNSLIYLDPPYLQSSKSKLAFCQINHNTLLELCIDLQNKCKIILSGYDSVLYNSNLKNWNTSNYTRASCGKNSNKTSNFVTEKIWFNF